MFVPFERLHRAYEGKGLAAAIAGMPDVKDRITYTVDFVERTTGLKNVGHYITILLELDAFTLNEDRHTNNLAVIRNEKTREFRLCPIFGNGLALLSDTKDYPLSNDTYACISSVQAKPFDAAFDVQFDAAEELYGLHLKFYFGRTEISEMLSKLTSLYDCNTLARVETVLLEQMRKYRVFF